MHTHRTRQRIRTLAAPTAAESLRLRRLAVCYAVTDCDADTSIAAAFRAAAAAVKPTLVDGRH